MTYAKTTMLSGYVACTQLDNMGYVTKVELEAAYSELDIPDRLRDRFYMVKKEVIEPGGLLCQLEDSVKELSSKKGSSEVTMGGMSFRDQVSTEAWTSILGYQEVISYGYDMVVHN